MPNQYLLDTNILITSFRRTYPFDIAPGFWDYLIEKGREGIIVISEPIKQEIYKNDDELSKWLKSNESNFSSVQASDPLVIQKYKQIINLLQKDSRYYESAKREFASSADSWLIAIALAYNFTIVTEETYNHNGHNKVKIPNECKRNGIVYINTTEFMRVTNFLWR